MSLCVNLGCVISTHADSIRAVCGDAVASETAQAATASAAQGPTDAPTFNTMRSHNHISGAQLLLQQSGALFDTNLNMFGVGAYARPSDTNKGQPVQQQQQPGMPEIVADQPVDGFGSPVGEEDDAAPPPNDLGDLWCGDDGGGDDGWGEKPLSPSAGPMDANEMPPAPVEDGVAMGADVQPAPADPAADVDAWDSEEEDEDLGVWEPLDPHEKTPGGKPFHVHKVKEPKCVANRTACPSRCATSTPLRRNDCALGISPVTSHSGVKSLCEGISKYIQCTSSLFLPEQVVPTLLQDT